MNLSLYLQCQPRVKLCSSIFLVRNHKFFFIQENKQLNSNRCHSSWTTMGWKWNLFGMWGEVYNHQSQTPLVCFWGLSFPFFFMFIYFSRHCGRVLCKRCSMNELPIMKFNLQRPVRVCQLCNDVLTLGVMAARWDLCTGKQHELVILRGWYVERISFIYIVFSNYRI